MSTFFEDHPQRRAQWQRRRRNNAVPTGTCVIHTYEAPAGRTARAGADYFLIRPEPASYHWLADAHGDTIHLAPWSGEAWHDTSSNNWSVGISMMVHAAQWAKITAQQRDHLVNGAALGAHRYSRWLVSQGKPPIPARRINRAQAMRREAGFTSHGEMDPGRRSDPGKDFPWAQFLAEFSRLESGNPPTSEEDTMSPDQEKKFEKRLDQIVEYFDDRAAEDARRDAEDAKRDAELANRIDRLEDALAADISKVAGRVWAYKGVGALVDVYQMLKDLRVAILGKGKGQRFDRGDLEFIDPPKHAAPEVEPVAPEAPVTEV